jgi:hypothetical protein
MGQWAKKDICNEQHGHCGPSWVVHLCRPKLLGLLSCCEHLMALECVQKLMLILCPWG